MNGTIRTKQKSLTVTVTPENASGSRSSELHVVDEDVPCTQYAYVVADVTR